MGNVATFPTFNPLKNGHLGLSATFKAGAAITAGQVVCFDATGEEFEVIPAVATAGTAPIGVAVHDIASGSKGTIALIGSIVYVCGNQTDQDYDAGDYVFADDNSIGGTISAIAPAALAATYSILGILLEDLTGATAGGTARMLITGPSVITGAHT